MTKQEHVGGVLENFTQVIKKASLSFSRPLLYKVEHLNCDQYRSNSLLVAFPWFQQFYPLALT
jgi:hypothetical protein